MPDFSTGLFIIALIWSVFCVGIGVTLGREIKNPGKLTFFLKDLTGFNYKKKGG